ncbi:hypothetical protein VR46_32265, partial [Streptomyces sp. NRRL S-444]
MNPGADDVSVPLPATVFAPPLSGSDLEDVAPPPGGASEAKTALIPGGSQLPRTAIAPALHLGADAGPDSGSIADAPTSKAQVSRPGAQPVTPPGPPGAPGAPGAPGVPAAPGG